LDLKFFQTTGVQALGMTQLATACALISKQFVGQEEFLVFKYFAGETEVTNGNGIILAKIGKRLFSQEVWAVYGVEEDKFCYYTFLLPSEY
jgi:hypothetical protein